MWNMIKFQKNTPEWRQWGRANGVVLLTWTYLTPCSSVFTNFEHAIAGWEVSQINQGCWMFLEILRKQIVNLILDFHNLLCNSPRISSLH